MMEQFENNSVIRLHGYYNSDHCGYCKHGYPSSYGIFSQKLKPEDYKALMIIGWRRSGCFLYKPTMHKVFPISLIKSDYELNSSLLLDLLPTIYYTTKCTKVHSFQKPEKGFKENGKVFRN